VANNDDYDNAWDMVDERGRLNRETGIKCVCTHHARFAGGQQTPVALPAPDCCWMPGAVGCRCAFSGTMADGRDTMDWNWIHSRAFGCVWLIWDDDDGWDVCCYMAVGCPPFLKSGKWRIAREQRGETKGAQRPRAVAGMDMEGWKG
jgi:hypothetical protein